MLIRRQNKLGLIVIPAVGQSQIDKRSISAEFAKPDSKHHIIFATDAMGIGIDNPDIQLVVQWKQPPSMCALLQRAGRAARGRTVRGEFIWLVEAWCFGDRLDSPPQATNKSRTECERRSMLPRGLWELINRSPCIRKGILKFFGDDLSSYVCPVDPPLCCSRCAGDEITLRIGNAGQRVKSVQSQKHIVEAVKAALIQWRETKAAKVLSSTVFTDEKAQLILPDIAIRHISRTGATVNSIGTLATAVNEQWADLQVYGGEVVEVVQNACLQATHAKRQDRRALQ
jgi:superfamily II DNA helicase RecQ